MRIEFDESDWNEVKRLALSRMSDDERQANGLPAFGKPSPIEGQPGRYAMSHPMLTELDLQEIEQCGAGTVLSDADFMSKHRSKMEFKEAREAALMEKATAEQKARLRVFKGEEDGQAATPKGDRKGQPKGDGPALAR